MLGVNLTMDEETRKATMLWTSAQPIVASFVASVVRDSRDREDVLQETALAVFGAIESYDPQFPFNAWAIGIARNQIRLYLRRQKRDRHVFDESTVSSIEAAFGRVSPTPQLDHLPDCIAGLGDRAREMCVLRYENDLKPAAIGKKLGMSANAVSNALHRIRDRLRLCIESRIAVERQR